MKRLVALIVVAFLGMGLTTACSSDADVVSDNLSKDAENFKILRRVVFYNSITDVYMLVIEGYCSVETEEGNKLTVMCKTGKDEFKKHFLGRSDNVTWFAEQLEGARVSTDHYKVIFKPSVIIPDPEAR